MGIIEDLKGDQSWRIFRIISEFTEGFEKLSEVTDAISIFADIDSISCTSSTGRISIHAQGGTASFAFNWSNGQITPIVNNLNPGTYTVTISDENGCTLAQSFTLAPGGAPMISDSEVIPVTCSGEANGQITVEVNGALESKCVTVGTTVAF